MTTSPWSSSNLEHQQALQKDIITVGTVEPTELLVIIEKNKAELRDWEYKYLV